MPLSLQNRMFWGIATIPLTRLFIIGVRTAITSVLYGFTAAPETIPTRLKRREDVGNRRGKKRKKTHRAAKVKKILCG